MGKDKKLDAHLSPMAVWAFSIGTSVGWGSLVVTSNTYLSQSGPMGSVLGLVIGTLVMMVIGLNYAYMMKGYPDSGGAFSFTREAFGDDQGFLAAWFVAMTYFAILWANITSLPLFGRIFMGNIFRVGKMYTIFGYDVYLGEVLLSMTAIILIGLLCCGFKKSVDYIMIVLALLFSAGIVVCFIASFLKKSVNISPVYIPDSSVFSQIIKIAVISPWAFIGFESISHGTEEMKFDNKKIKKILIASIISTMLLYVFVTLTSVTAYPDRYGSWLEYINDIDNLDGIEALPAFYAANAYMGEFGVRILMLSLLALVLTSLIGNTFALSRLLYSMSREKILPKSFSKLNKNAIPQNAIMLVVCISVLIPLIGRTAIGWIVDVTTVGATIIYGFVSAATIKIAKEHGDKKESWLGRLGLILMLLYGAYLLFPNLVSKGTLARETYFLFIVWSVLGFLIFRIILYKDKEKRFGSSIIVWLALLALLLFISLIWMRQSMLESDSRIMNNVKEYYEENADEVRAEDEQYFLKQVDTQSSDNTKTMIMALGMFTFALIIMLTNHTYMNRRANENEAYKKQSDVGLTDYCINLLHTRNRDNHHVVLGVRKA